MLQHCMSQRALEKNACGDASNSTKLAHRLQSYKISIDPQQASKINYAQLFLSCMLNYASIMYTGLVKITIEYSL